MKILISWVGWADFKNSGSSFEVSDTSPNIDIHKNRNFKFKKHILLSTAKDDINDKEYKKAMLLYSELSKLYRNIDFKIKFLDVEDAYDLSLVTQAAEAVLDEIKKEEINILFSMGTSIMSVAWFNLYERKPYRIKMIFGRDPKYLRKGKPQFEEVTTTTIAPGIQKISQKKYSDSTTIKITPSIEPVYNKAKIAAKYDDVNILILGESGTGKEELAKFIQRNSPRADKELITVNCAALGDSLLESRLFGYVKGAFTGANFDTDGFFQTANKGVIFLDEIGDISPKLQQSLLRVLQTGEIQKVGSVKTIKVDVRIIAATNKNLLEEVKNGNFREDLYYRLNEVSLRLPSLAEYSLNDKKELVKFYIKQYKNKFGKNIDFNDECLKSLSEFEYPGNIRQLSSIIKYIYIFNDNKADKDCLSEFKTTNKNIGRYEDFELLDDIKRFHINRIYKIYGQKKLAAKKLGIEINTLNKYIET